MRMSLRKTVFIVGITLLTILAAFIIIKGVKIGNFEILGITGIIQKDKDIDTKNKKLATDASTTYVTKVATLEATAKSLQNKKDEYTNEAVLVSSAAGEGYVSTTEKYEIEYLWTRIGNYAKDENVDIKMDVTNSTISGKFDLNFTVKGSYVGITDFIYDIENDSKLGFKIENFVMQSLDDNVQATFSCKQININLTNLDSSSSEESKDGESAKPSTDKSTTSNTTKCANTTSSNTTTNTTNSTLKSTTAENTSKTE